MLIEFTWATSEDAAGWFEGRSIDSSDKAPHTGQPDFEPVTMPEGFFELLRELAKRQSEGPDDYPRMPFDERSPEQIARLQDETRRFLNRIADQNSREKKNQDWRSLRDEIQDLLSSDNITTHDAYAWVPMDAVPRLNDDGRVVLDELRLRSPEAFVAITLLHLVSHEPHAIIRRCVRDDCAELFVDPRQKNPPRTHCRAKKCLRSRAAERQRNSRKQKGGAEGLASMRVYEGTM